MISLVMSLILNAESFSLSVSVAFEKKKHKLKYSLFL